MTRAGGASALCAESCLRSTSASLDAALPCIVCLMAMVYCHSAWPRFPARLKALALQGGVCCAVLCCAVLCCVVGS